MNDGLSTNNKDDKQRGLKEEKDCLNIPNSELMLRQASTPRMPSLQFAGQILAILQGTSGMLGLPRLSSSLPVTSFGCLCLATPGVGCPGWGAVTPQQSGEGVSARGQVTDSLPYQGQKCRTDTQRAQMHCLASPAEPAGLGGWGGRLWLCGEVCLTAASLDCW